MKAIHYATIVIIATCACGGGKVKVLIDIDTVGPSPDNGDVLSHSDVQDDALDLPSLLEVDSASDIVDVDAPAIDVKDAKGDGVDATVCKPACEFSDCGHECSGTCGSCPLGQYCGHGFCAEGPPPDFGNECEVDADCRSGACIPVADGHVCTMTCAGECPSGWECAGQTSVGTVCIPREDCIPHCEGKACGGDGCGGQCGSCLAGQACATDSNCHQTSDGCTPNFEVGTCGGCDCEACVCSLDEFCCSYAWDEQCVGLCKTCGGWCSACQPKCDNKTCGPDGCDGTCGTCPNGLYCWYGSCLESVPPDIGKTCTDDDDCLSGVCILGETTGVCSMTCAGACPVGWDCKELVGIGSVCVPSPACVPSCLDRECGPDGCGGSCGSCDSPEICSLKGTCTVPSDGCTPRLGVSTCGGCDCEPHVCAAFPHCCALEWDAACVAACADQGGCSTHCVAQCDGKNCGPDGCGGFCGYCLPWESCQAGKCRCEPQCGSRECGSDGCGGTCGECPATPEPKICNSIGKCVAQYDGCLAKDSPGCFNCACQACVCEERPYCCTQLWDQGCVELCVECGTNCEG